MTENERRINNAISRLREAHEELVAGVAPLAAAKTIEAIEAAERAIFWMKRKDVRFGE